VNLSPPSVEVLTPVRGIGCFLLDEGLASGFTTDWWRDTFGGVLIAAFRLKEHVPHKVGSGEHCRLA